METPPPDATATVVALAGVPGLVERHLPPELAAEVDRRVAAGLGLVLALEERLGVADVPADLEAELLDRHARLVARVAS